jgi:hypothetical protein
MAKTTVTCAILLTAAVMAHAQETGPFGLRMGMSRTELQPLIDKTFQEQSPGVLAVKVPKPHPDFETYLVIVSPTHGLCRISALGKNISMNSFGDQVKDSFTEMRQVLEGRYGKPEDID